MRRQITTDYAKIRQELLCDEGIFSDEAQRTRIARRVILTLTQAEQTIFLLYADCGSSRKVARMLNIPRTTMQREINRIKRKLQDGILESLTPRHNRSLCC